MSVTPEAIAAARDLFSGMGEITTRKMMGGLCFYHRGTIFAILHPEAGLMLKGAGPFHDTLAAAGCTRWTYRREASDTVVAMPYWTIPEEALDDPDLACDWARRALAHL
jgi:DNA transformation protein